MKKIIFASIIIASFSSCRKCVICNNSKEKITICDNSEQYKQAADYGFISASTIGDYLICK